MATKPLYTYLAIAACVIMICSCSKRTDTAHSLDVNATNDSKYNFKEFTSKKYRTKVKMILGEIKSYRGDNHVNLFSVDTFGKNDTDYKSVPGMKTICEIPVGSVVQAEELILDSGIGSQLWITIRVSEGQTGGMTVYASSRLFEDNKYLDGALSKVESWEFKKAMFDLIE